jgi:hypothetical protein
MPCSWYLWKVGVNPLGLRLFGAMMWKLIIEPFFQWKLNKIETKNCIEIWGCSSCCWKVFNKSYLINFISRFLELRCGRYWFMNGFCCWKFKQIVKIGFELKISWVLNVFTLESMAQTTLLMFKVITSIFFLCSSNLSLIMHLTWF